jgi:hypothetical protein
LQADLPAGGVQVDAGFLIGFLFVVGFADREDRNAILDGEAVIALGDEVGVLPGGNREVLAGSQDMVLGVTRAMPAGAAIWRRGSDQAGTVPIPPRVALMPSPCPCPPGCPGWRWRS